MSSEYIIHYGVKGMKWKIQKAANKAKDTAEDAVTAGGDAAEDAIDELEYLKKQRDLKKKMKKTINSREITSMNETFSTYEKNSNKAKKARIKRIKEKTKSRARRNAKRNATRTARDIYGGIKANRK